MSKLPLAAFWALIVATLGAFFITQHLKVSTPLTPVFLAESTQFRQVKSSNCRLKKGLSHCRLQKKPKRLEHRDEVRAQRSRVRNRNILRHPTINGVEDQLVFRFPTTVEGGFVDTSTLGNRGHAEPFISPFL